MEIVSYVIVSYQGYWYLGYVFEMDIDKKTAKINFLHPNGPYSFFVHPRKPDILEVLFSILFLTSVEVSTLNGRTRNMSRNQQESASKSLQNYTISKIITF